MVKTIEATNPLMAKYPATVTIQYFMKNRSKRPKNFYCGYISQVDTDVDQVNVITEVGILQNVPVDYMTCDSRAFITGDHVLVYCQNCDLLRAKVIGFCAGTKTCLTNALVWKYYPDTNYPYSFAIYRGATTNDFYRTYFETLLSGTNKTLHVYCWFVGIIGDLLWQPVDCHAIDVDLWEFDELTWNNQPALGALLSSQTISSIGWKTFAIGSAKSVCLKFNDESQPSGSWRIDGRSFNYTVDPTKRPYITEA